MAYSPNDRGPDIPPTRGRSRSAGLWLGLIALLLIGGIIWSQSGTNPGTDPATTASTTQNTLPASPGPEAPENAQSGTPATPANPTTR